MKRLMFLLFAACVSACGGVDGDASRAPLAAARGTESTIVSGAPGMFAQPSTADFFQSPLYAPGGPKCGNAANVACQQLDPPFQSNQPQEYGGYQGPWGLTSSNTAVATAMNCVGAVACAYPNTGFEITAGAPGFARITVTGNKGASTDVPVTVTETTLVVEMYGLPDADSLQVVVNSSACDYGLATPNAYALFPATDDTSRYVFTLVNAPIPPCSGDTFEVIVRHGSREIKSKISEPKTIVAGRANTLWFGISNDK
jgi:hypothetical protein